MFDLSVCHKISAKVNKKKHICKYFGRKTFFSCIFLLFVNKLYFFDRKLLKNLCISKKSSIFVVGIGDKINKNRQNPLSALGAMLLIPIATKNSLQASLQIVFTTNLHDSASKKHSKT